MGPQALLFLLLSFALATVAPAQTAAVPPAAVQAGTLPLLLPAGLAYDQAGDLLFAESGNHVIRKVTPAGVLSTVAGNGTQGFAGDGSPATQAMLDSPAAVAVDSSGNLFIADTRNHRIRRLDAVTGLISTYAGNGTPGACPNTTLASACALDLPTALAFNPNQDLCFADVRAHLIRCIDHGSSAVTTLAGKGTQGFSGDGGPATAAALDSPYGLAFDSAGNLYLADMHNQRIRRVDAATHRIATVAGTGESGFAGDAAPAAAAQLALPRGLTLDSAGNLYLVDAANQRIRRIDAATGQISTLAGTGAQGYAGDHAPAIAAMLNSPRGIALTPAGVPIFADAANGRIREISPSGDILTYAGLGNTPGSVLTLSGPAVTQYGSGALAATLVGSPASGSVDLFEVLPGGLGPLATGSLAANSASFSLASLPAGNYRLEATYPGDATHAAAQSNTVGIVIAQAPAEASVNGASMLYGQALPTLNGTLTGILAQDTGNAVLTLATPATPLSQTGTYPIVATLGGAAAGNYALTQNVAGITIDRAPALATLTQTLAAHITSSTRGTPTGNVTLLDGANPAGSLPLSSTGDATFASSALTVGSHTLTAAYQGDANFLPATSAPVIITIQSPVAADFTLAATGQTTQVVAAGSTATFSFLVTPVNGALPGAIQLAISGLPTGATASFNPAYLPPSGSPSSFTLSIRTAAPLDRPSGVPFALLLPFGLVAAIRRRKVASLLLPILLLTGCSDRVFTPRTTHDPVAYNLTVTATATSANGAILLHTASVSLATE